MIHDQWTCHVCGEWRPGHRIAVYTLVETLTASPSVFIPWRINVRYCRDRPVCAAVAPIVAAGWAADVALARS